MLAATFVCLFAAAPSPTDDVPTLRLYQRIAAKCPEHPFASPPSPVPPHWPACERRALQAWDATLRSGGSCDQGWWAYWSVVVNCG